MANPNPLQSNLKHNKPRAIQRRLSKEEKERIEHEEGEALFNKKKADMSNEFDEYLLNYMIAHPDKEQIAKAIIGIKIAELKLKGVVSDPGEEQQFNFGEMLNASKLIKSNPPKTEE